MGEKIWFYTYEENFYYFLEEDNNTKEDINSKENVKIQKLPKSW